MIKVGKEKNLRKIKDKYDKKIIMGIEAILQILDNNYGKERDVENDLGGYVLIAENIIDIEMLKQDKLKGLIPEYTDLIECKEGVNWTSSLFLLSNDYAIVVLTTEELSKSLLE